MKICPICDERYDEDVILFCTKDGTPLVDEKQPNFTALPSEPLDEPDMDFGEETIISRKPTVSTVDSTPYDLPQQGERIVIPTSPAPGPQQIRPRTTQAYYPPPPSNTAKTVALTILGTVVVLGFGALLFWFLQKETPANVNVNRAANANQNVNLNTNLGFDSNFNFNSTANYSTNYNLPTALNANIKSPSPTPKLSPSPSISPSPSTSPSTTPTPKPTPANRPEVNTNATPTATPRTGPRPPPLVINRPAGNGN